MVRFGEQETLFQEGDTVRERRTEDVRPGDRLTLVDDQLVEIVVRGRDRRKGINWKVVAWIWIAASAVHAVHHLVAR